MGHLFNRCPLVNDRLRRLLWEEVMNTHQLVLPTTTTVIPNVFVLGTQAMNISIGHTIVLVNLVTTYYTNCTMQNQYVTYFNIPNVV